MRLCEKIRFYYSTITDPGYHRKLTVTDYIVTYYYYTFISSIDWRAFLNTFTNRYTTNLWLNTNKYKHTYYTYTIHIYIQYKVNAESICLYIRTVTRTHTHTHKAFHTVFSLHSHLYYYLDIIRSIILHCILHGTIWHWNLQIVCQVKGHFYNVFWLCTWSQTQ